MTMRALTDDDLLRLMTSCMVGVEYTLDPDAYLDSSFEELDFDSLAWVEMGERLREAHDVDVPDDELVQSRTPRALLQLINEHLAA